jgi:predicted acylesterase/phospholipase RssA
MRPHREVTMGQPVRDDLSEAKDYLRGRRGNATVLAALAKRLKAAEQFRYARRLFGRARSAADAGDDPPDRVWLAQQEALCTYKDPDLPNHARLERALAILGSVEDLATTQNQETLSLAGAIYKRKFEVDGQSAHLERSLAYYLRAYQLGVEADQGYAAINAAFVLDVLACQEMAQAEQAGSTSETAAARQSQARRIRTHIVSALPPLESKEGFEPNWWYFVTMGEAFFGLEAYEPAAAWLRRATEYAAQRPADDPLRWEFETTAKQLATLARLQSADAAGGPVPEDSPQWAVVRAFLRADGTQLRTDAALRTAFAGKVGLALSGGGFRASLFHIGVLARLAELDMLRHVEVLSCVSGGSIIGAHYYLEVRRLLQEKAQEQIGRDDYIEIVQRLERDFLAGVQKNIRTRVIGGLFTNLKMLFVPGYSRTRRVGELFEKHLYSQVESVDRRKGSGILLNDLYIHPKDEDGERFRPKRDNWRRKHKVPVLILNATPLNTGHNWQFTASWMGEPPADIDEEVDTNARLRRLYYREAPARHQEVRLGYAVAASACVPGLFEPLPLDRLYPDRTVRLVDGGVHDNQGVASLIEQECNVLLVSDASGQMGAVDDPGDGVLDVPLRSNSILMARVREAQFRDLSARHRTGLVRGLMFLHLKKDLEADPVDWIDCEDPYEAGEAARPPDRRGVLTSYGIRKDVQARLAEVRTDLDSFADAEALALMVSGYRMAAHEFARRIEGFDTTTPPQTPPWRFLDIEPRLSRQPGHGFEAQSAAERRQTLQDNERMLRILAVAKSRAFKVWHLLPALKVAALVLGVAAVGGLAYWIWLQRARSIAEFGVVSGVTIGGIGMTLATLALGLLVGRTIVRMLDIKKTLSRAAIAAGLAVVGWAGAALHLAVFDPLYLRHGRVQRRRYVPPPKDAPTPPTEPVAAAVEGPTA